MTNSIHDIMRAKHEEAKKHLLQQVMEMRFRPTDIEAEIRCMWEMILGSNDNGH